MRVKRDTGAIHPFTKKMLQNAKTNKSDAVGEMQIWSESGAVEFSRLLGQFE